MAWIDDLVVSTSEGLDDRVLEALYGRGVTDDQIRLYRIGHLDKKLPDLPYPKTFLDWSSQGSKLDDVLVLPLTNAAGDVKGLQFRHVEEERKGYMDYIPEKGEAILFGLGQALPHIWHSQRILVVEGAFDLFPLQRFFPEVVATLTAHVYDTLTRILRRTCVRDLWLGYDNDEAGRGAVKEIQKWLGKEFRIHVLNFPKVSTLGGRSTKDPSDLWQAWGEQRFGSYIRPLIEKAGDSFERF